MVGNAQGGVTSFWGKRIAALLVLGGALASWSCSSGSPDGGPNGNIPPPLNQPCDTDSDCGELKCDPLRGCLPCVFDWHCAKGERCTDDGCKVPSPCKGDADCSDKPKASHCDPVIGECVGCRVESDCPKKSHCIERSCVSYTPCVNSRDCAEGTVCDRDAGECVECLGNGDCEKDKEVCVAAHCVPVCTSDKDCADRNQLCRRDKGYCADCVEQSDCPSIYFCDRDQCKLDVCKPGETRCAAGGGYTVCNSNGSGYDYVQCPISNSCSDAGGVATCTPWRCTPNSSDCDATGKTVKQCATDGLSIATEIDCAADGQQCYLGQCKPKLCEPGTSFCQGKELRECLANGTASSLKLACGNGQYCNPTTLTCATQKCTPGADLCDGNRVTHCDSAGAGTVGGGTDCAKDGRVCYNGECREVVCTGTALCKGNDAYSCAENGTAAKLATSCSSSSYCLNGSCYVDTCTAGSAVCDGTVASTCKADGSGAEPGGTDCAASDQVCVSGACVPKVCTLNSYFCADGNSQRCNATGTASSLAATCTAAQFCNLSTGRCQTDVCTAGDKLCDGNIVTTCNADGSGPAAGGTDCAADNKVCYLGTCLPKICNPNEYFCQNGHSYLCGSTGATSTLNDTCQTNEYCNPGSVQCLPDTCTAGAPTCNGANLATCAADGSGPGDAGTSCGSGNTCFQGACKPVICTLDDTQCSNGTIQRCVNAGTAWSTVQTCDAAAYCNELVKPVVCAADICAASSTACNAEKLATCSADGGHFASTSTDCAASNTVCSLTGACAAVASDTVGDTTSTTSLNTYLVGNVYRVDRARTLTKIEQYLSVSGTSVFTWVVYEATAADGPFTKVFEKTTTDSGTGAFIGSGTVSVPLAAGKFYVLGVVVQSTFTRYGSQAGATPFVSFGRLLNGLQVYATPVPTSFNLSTVSLRTNQRISTGP